MLIRFKRSQAFQLLHHVLHTQHRFAMLTAMPLQQVYQLHSLVEQMTCSTSVQL
jgi:hypothetical protein